MDSGKPGVRRERLEISHGAFERRFLVDDGLPSSKPNISAPTPPSELLSRLQNFLPAMQSANKQLGAAASEPVQIDHASDEEGPYVELDLACGLFDLKDEAAVAAAERSLINRGVAVERFGGNSSSSSDSEDDSTSDGSEDEAGEAVPMEAEAAGAGGAASGDAANGRQGSGSGSPQQQQQQQPGAAARAVGRRRVKAKRKQRPKIEVLS